MNKKFSWQYQNVFILLGMVFINACLLQENGIIWINSLVKAFSSLKRFFFSFILVIFWNIFKDNDFLLMMEEILCSSQLAGTVKWASSCISQLPYFFKNNNQRRKKYFETQRRPCAILVYTLYPTGYLMRILLHVKFRDSFSIFLRQITCPICLKAVK